MVYILATLANDPDYTPSLLYALGNQLRIPKAGDNETWGLGYYADARALIARKPAEILNDRSIFELAPEVKSRIVLSCVRQDGGLDQAPPYRMKNWLFGFSGDLDPLAQLGPKLGEKLPNFIRSEIVEKDGGQLAFGMFISELHRATFLNDPLVGPAVLGRTLVKAAQTISTLCEEAFGAPIRASYTLTNGRQVFAVQAGVPLFWKKQEGLEALPDGPPDPALTDFKQIAAALKHFRAIVIAKDVDDKQPGWAQIPDRTLFLVDGQLEVTQESFS